MTVERYNFTDLISMMRNDFDTVSGADAMEEVRELYQGVLYYSVSNLHLLMQVIDPEYRDEALSKWIEAGKGQHKKANIESLTIFRSNLLPASDYEKVVEDMKDLYLNLQQQDDDDDRVRDMKKRLVLAMFSINFTLLFEGGEEAYEEAQAWLMDREFGDIK